MRMWGFEVINTELEEFEVSHFSLSDSSLNYKINKISQMTMI